MPDSGSGLNISETTDLLGFSHTKVSSLQRMVQKHPVRSSSAVKNVLLMREVSGEGPDWSKLHYNSRASLNTQHVKPLKWIGYSSRRG